MTGISGTMTLPSGEKHHFIYHPETGFDGTAAEALRHYRGRITVELSNGKIMVLRRALWKENIIGIMLRLWRWASGGAK